MVFLVELGFDLRAFCLLSRHSYHLSQTFLCWDFSRYDLVNYLPGAGISAS
jgi:hypothetical protein